MVRGWDTGEAGVARLEETCTVGVVDTVEVVDTAAEEDTEAQEDTAAQEGTAAWAARTGAT